MHFHNKTICNSDGVSEEYLWVNNCGYQSFNGKNLSIRRYAGRKDYQFIYVCEGNGFYCLNGEFRQIGAGNLVLFRPGEPQLYDYRPESSYKGYWLHFTGSGVEHMLEMAGISGPLTPVGTDPAVSELFRRIMREFQRKPGGYQMMCAALLGELIVLLGRKGTLSGLDEAPLSRVAPAVDYLHDHFQTEISLEECARLCQMSKYHFIRQFTALTGTPPHAYQTELRLQRARDLLADSTLNVSEVAASVGYENPLYFSRIFRKYTGCSPRNYRDNTRDSLPDEATPDKS